MNSPKGRVLKLLFSLVLGLTLTFTIVFMVAGYPSTSSSFDLTRITTASAYQRKSKNVSLNSDGSVLAFESDSDFLGESIPSNQFEIWLYFQATKSFERITLASDGDRDSYSPSLSGDGKLVAFHSDSDLLGQGIPDGQNEIWLYDTTTMTLTRVTTATDSTRSSQNANISADGKVVAFQSDSDFLGQGIPEDQIEIWLYDIKTKTYTRATTGSTSNRDSIRPSINADGSIVAFQSNSDFLDQGLSDGHQEIWLYNTTTMTYTRVTTATPGALGGYSPSLNADGTIVSFENDSDFLSEGIPPYQFEIWLYDTGTMTVTRVTYASESDRASGSSSINADGTKITFHSDSDFLGEGIQYRQFEVWIYDTVTSGLQRVTLASDTDRDSFRASLSADGSVLGFHSNSDFLGESILSTQNEIWLTILEHRIFLPLITR